MYLESLEHNIMKSREQFEQRTQIKNLRSAYRKRKNSDSDLKEKAINKAELGGSFKRKEI